MRSSCSFAPLANKRRLSAEIILRSRDRAGMNFPSLNLSLDRACARFETASSSDRNVRYEIKSAKELRLLPTNALSSRGVEFAGSHEKLALFFRISVREGKGRAKGVGERDCWRVDRISRERWRRRGGEDERRRMAEREKRAGQENGDGGRLFMGTHNSRPLLKLPPGNGLRQPARNLSKFPQCVIYSGPAMPFRITRTTCRGHRLLASLSLICA